MDSPHFSVDLSDNVVYILEHHEFDVVEEDAHHSPPRNVESTEIPSNTPSALSAPSGGSTLSMGSKRKSPMVYVIQSQVSMLNANLGHVVQYMKEGNDVASEFVGIARIQAIASQDVIGEIRRYNHLYG